MNNGTVKWFNAEKVLASSKEKMVATYSYTLSNRWRWIQIIRRRPKVEFDIVEGDRGEQVANVVKNVILTYSNSPYYRAVFML